MSEYNEFILEYAETLDNADIFEEFNNYCIQEGYAKLIGSAILSLPKAILNIIRWILETLFKFLKKLKNTLSAKIKIKGDKNGNVKVLLPEGVRIDDDELSSMKTFFKTIMTQYNIVVGSTNQLLSKAYFNIESKTNPMLDTETLTEVMDDAKNVIKEELDRMSNSVFLSKNLKFDTEVEMPADQVRKAYTGLKNLYVDLNNFSKQMLRGYKELDGIYNKLNKKSDKYDAVKLGDANKAMSEMSKVFTDVQKFVTTSLKNIDDYAVNLTSTLVAQSEDAE
jgi:hypothetical protein